MSRNIVALSEATRRRTQTAQEAVQGALREARKSGAPVSFKGIAQSAGVSTDFIYDHPDLRSAVEALRRRRPMAPATAVVDGDLNAAESALIRRLGDQIVDLRRKHREEVGELRRALEAAHGELLALRRELEKTREGAGSWNLASRPPAP